jgi:hypothetical protein
MKEILLLDVVDSATNLGDLFIRAIGISTLSVEQQGAVGLGLFFRVEITGR